MEEQFQKLIRKYSTTSWYYFLDRILKSDDEDWLEKRRTIFFGISEEPHVQKQLIAWLLQKIILYTNFHRKNHPVKLEDVRDVLRIINELIEADSRQPETTEGIKYLLFTVRKAQSQYHVANNTFAQFHRIFLLFDEIPFLPEMEKYNREHGINLNKAFSEIFKTEIVNYLKFCFMLSAQFLFYGSTLKVSDFIKTCRKFISETFNTVSLLERFSADRKEALNHEALFLPKDVRYKYRAIPLLKIKPILRNGPNGKELYAPFPYLIINKAIDVVYFELHKKYKNKFTAWFGRLLEQYCGRIIRETFKDAVIFSPEEGPYKGKKDEIIDFIVLKGDVAILIECKAARIYRSLTESDDEEQVRETFSHITKAHNQLTSFATAIGHKKEGLEKFFGITQFYGVIVTWDEFAPKVNDDGIMEEILGYYNKNYTVNMPFKIFSVNRLEQLQASLVKSRNSVRDFAMLYDGNFMERWAKLIAKIKTKDSLLDRNFTAWADVWIPSEFRQIYSNTERYYYRA